MQSKVIKAALDDTLLILYEYYVVHYEIILNKKI